MPLQQTDLAVTLADVEAARERVRNAVYCTPCGRSAALSELTGQQVYLKLENLQITGAFKERGALNRLSLLTPQQSCTERTTMRHTPRHAAAAMPMGLRSSTLSMTRMSSQGRAQ